MFLGITESASTQQGDSAEFISKVQAVVAGVARDCEPARLYVVRIDNWFGPKWMHFAGKFTVGKSASIGVHKTILHVPPFIPHRVVSERVLAGPDYKQVLIRPPLHIECTSKQALTRRLAEVDKEAAFVWFSSESEVQKRGSIMVYLPVASEMTPKGRDRYRRTGAFYIGFLQHAANWEPAMLRGVSRGEVAYLEGAGNSVDIQSLNSMSMKESGEPTLL